MDKELTIAEQIEKDIREPITGYTTPLIEMSRLNLLHLMKKIYKEIVNREPSMDPTINQMYKEIYRLIVEKTDEDMKRRIDNELKQDPKTFKHYPYQTKFNTTKYENEKVETMSDRMIDGLLDQQDKFHMNLYMHLTGKEIEPGAFRDVHEVK